MRKSSEEARSGRLKERRNGARYTLILRAGLIEQAGKSSLCLVKNISASGLQIKFFMTPVAGAPVSIRVADEPAVRGFIVWVKGDIAGMSFLKELDAATLLRVQQKLKPNRRRSIPRINVEATATLRTGGRTCRAMICDISSLGTRIRTRSPLTAGDRAILDLADLPPLNAFVRWSDGEESGLVFETALPMPIIAGWVEGRLRLSA